MLLSRCWQCLRAIGVKGRSHEPPRLFKVVQMGHKVALTNQSLVAV